MRVGTAVWSVSFDARAKSVDLFAVRENGAALRLDTFVLPVLPEFVPLSRALVAIAPVTRVRNADLWDALATGVLRQVIRAGQARQLYARLCDAYGERFETPAGPVCLLPSPEVLLKLTDREFSALGLGFKRAPLRAAAAAVCDQGHRWADLAPDNLLIELQSVHRVGPWTAGAAVADLTNDFAFYPHGDLAVRTWARRLAPDMSWPDNERAFATRWRHLAGPHLSALTAVTLAQGGMF
jgi:DNA-3-methyladenine glycosylase II